MKLILKNSIKDLLLAFIFLSFSSEAFAQSNTILSIESEQNQLNYLVTYPSNRNYFYFNFSAPTSNFNFEDIYYTFKDPNGNLINPGLKLKVNDFRLWIDNLNNDNIDNNNYRLTVYASEDLYGTLEIGINEGIIADNGDVIEPVSTLLPVDMRLPGKPSAELGKAEIVSGSGTVVGNTLYYSASTKVNVVFRAFSDLPGSMSGDGHVSSHNSNDYINSIFSSHNYNGGNVGRSTISVNSNDPALATDRENGTYTYYGEALTFNGQTGYSYTDDFRWFPDGGNYGANSSPSRPEDLFYFVYETTKPSFIISDSENPRSNNQTIDFRIVLSEELKSDLSISNFELYEGSENRTESLISLTKIDSKNYTLQYSASSGFDGNAQVRLIQGTVTDLAGNKNNLTSVSIPIEDQVVPSVGSYSLTTETAYDGVPNTIQFTFNEAISSSPTISIINPASGTDVVDANLNSVGDSNKIWSYTWTPNVGNLDKSNAEVSISATDLNGNLIQDSDVFSIEINNNNPRVEITSNNILVNNNNSTSLLTINSSQDSSDFDISDIVLQGSGGLSNFTKISNKEYQVLYTPTTNTEENVSISINENSFSGENSTGNLPVNYVFQVDTKLPELTEVIISSNNSTSSSIANPNNTITINLQASEAINIDAATIGNLNAQIIGSDTQWSLSLTSDQVQNLTEGSVTFSIDFSDLNGNSGTSVSNTSDNSAVEYDNLVSSTVQISISDGNNIVSDNEEVLISFLFNEKVDSDNVFLDIDFTNNSYDILNVNPTQDPNNPLLFTYQWVVDGQNSDTDAGVLIKARAKDVFGNNIVSQKVVSVSNQYPTFQITAVDPNNPSNLKDVIGFAMNSSAGKWAEIRFTPSTLLKAVPESGDDLEIGEIQINFTPDEGSGEGYPILEGLSKTQDQASNKLYYYGTLKASNDNAAEGTVTITVPENSFIDIDDLGNLEETFELRYDTKGPTISTYEVKINNQVRSGAKPGDTINLKFTASERIKPGFVLSLGNNTQVLSPTTLDNKTWEVNILTSESTSFGNDAKIGGSINSLYDYNGNFPPTTNINTDILFDGVPPEDPVFNYANNYLLQGEEITISIDDFENLAGDKGGLLNVYADIEFSENIDFNSTAQQFVYNNNNSAYELPMSFQMITRQM